MEKYKTIILIEKIRKCLEEGKPQEALEIAEGIDKKKLKNMSDLSVVAESYFQNVKYEEAKKLYIRIYQKTPSRRIVAQLVHLSIKLNDIEDANLYLKEFIRIAPKDFYQYIFRFSIDKMAKAPLAKLIEDLVDLKHAEYIESWAYELAKLYHKAGMKEECLAECDDIVLWFGNGEYVERAKALRAYYRGEIQIDDESKITRADVSEDVTNQDEKTSEPDSEGEFDAETVRGFEIDSESGFEPHVEEEVVIDSEGDLETEAVLEFKTDSDVEEESDYTEDMDESTSGEVFKENSESYLETTIDSNYEKKSKDIVGVEEPVEGNENIDDDFMNLESALAEQLELSFLEEEKLPVEETKLSDSDDELSDEFLSELEKEFGVALQDELSTEGKKTFDANTSESMKLDESSSKEEKFIDAENPIEDFSKELDPAEMESSLEEENLNEALDPAEMESSLEDENLNEALDTAEEESSLEEENTLEDLDPAQDENLLAQADSSDTDHFSEEENSLEESNPSEETSSGVTSLFNGNHHDFDNTELENQVKAEIRRLPKEKDLNELAATIEMAEVSQSNTENSSHHSTKSQKKINLKVLTNEQLIGEEEEELLEQVNRNQVSLSDIFGNFMRMELVHKQLIRSMDQILTQRTKNVILTGESHSGKTRLAKSYAKWLHRMKLIKSTKIALIDGEKLNHMNLVAKKETLKDCVIIIEHAGMLAKETMKSLLDLSDLYQNNVAIILEDTREKMNQLLRGNSQLNSIFNNRIHLHKYSLEDYMGFAYDYISEHDYEIEMEAFIALQNEFAVLMHKKRENALPAIFSYLDGVILKSEKRSTQNLMEISQSGRYNDTELMVVKREDLKS